MIIYLFDPVTLEFIGAEEPTISIPMNSTPIPPYQNVAIPQYFVNGEWVFDNPFTAAVEKLVLPINAISIDKPKNGSIWKIGTKQVATLTANTLIPAGQFTAIVERIVRGVVVEDLRFDAQIVQGEGVNQLVLPLYFESSGNYQISAERLNQGLDEVELPFHVNFEKVDIDVVVAIPSI